MKVESNPLCVLWSESLQAPGGFRLVLRYLETGESFAYDVPALATALKVPPEDAPPLEACGEQRHVFSVELFSLPSLAPLDATSVTFDCP